jgi:RimJ/RimL family protein N-acetyltransferase
MELGEIILGGKEVALHPLTPNDAPALTLAAAESRQNYQFSPVPDGLDPAKQYIETALRQRQSGDRYPFVIQWNNRIVGSTSYSDYTQWQWPPNSPLQRRNIPDVVEIGHTWLAHSAQHTRCNTETKLLLLTHAFETWKVHRVSLRTDERNQRSRNAIERLRAKFEGIRRADKPATDGQVRDSALYSIIISEWPPIKERLKRSLSSPK